MKIVCVDNFNRETESDELIAENIKVRLKNTDKLTMVNKCLKVNGKPFVVEYPDEQLWDAEDNKLVTLFRGCHSMQNYWEPQDIKGYYAYQGVIRGEREIK